MDLLQIMRSRRSVRAYNDQPITQEQHSLPEQMRIVGFLALGQI